MKEKSSSIYPIKKIESETHKERESQTLLPIIDVIRHGKTLYKEQQDKSFHFDPRAEDFFLDTQHLDLTQEGIDELRETARQLLENVDTENEVILIISSPNFRAQSSALVVEDELRKTGAVILNSEKDIYLSETLRQITFGNVQKQDEWIRADKAWRAQKPERTKMPVEHAHKKIAASLHKSLDDFFAETHDEVSHRFQRFLRHMTNISNYLSEDTKAMLKDKRLRILAFTHEEESVQFMQQSLDVKENLKNGQILEIDPHLPLRKNKKSVAEVILYPKGDESESGRGKIVRQFKPRRSE